MDATFLWAVLFLAIGGLGWKLFDSAAGGFHHPSYGPPRGAKRGWGLFFMYIGFGMAMPFAYSALGG